MNEASIYWEHCEHLSNGQMHVIWLKVTSALSVQMIYIQYSLQLRNELILHVSFFKILSAGWNYVKTYHRALHTKWNVNVLCNVVHHQHFQRTLHLCSLQRTGLSVTGKGAGLMSPAGNPKAKPFLALSPSRLWNLLPVRFSKINYRDKMPSALVQLFQFPSEAGAEQPLEVLFPLHFYN